MNCVLGSIRQSQLIPSGVRIVVAVSGGADSLALMHLLRDFDIHVATFDHGLRGEASRADAEYVREMAQTWGLPVTVGYGKLDPASTNIEARAREARYAFLAEVARAINASHIATAHHADDQAETVLLHLLRGSGTRGLTGMRPKSPLPGAPDLTLIRPLLNITRAEIEAYCRDHQLVPRDDSTNHDLNYFRNRIRLDLLPHLREFNPQITAILNRLAETTNAENDFLDNLLRQQTTDAIQQAQDRVSIKLAVFHALHPVLQRRCVYDLITRLGGDVSYQHILAVVESGTQGGTGAMVSLQGGLRARIDYTTLVIEYTFAPPDSAQLLLPAGSEITLNIPGETLLPDDWRITFHEQPPFLLRIPLNATITLRTRLPGDTFAPPGLGGHRQKLKKWLIDHKVPQNLRDLLPLLVINNEIAAVLYSEKWIVAEHFKSPENFVITDARYMAVTVAKIEESSYS